MRKSIRPWFNKLNWDIIIEEAREQVRLGNETAIMGLGEKLEKLANQKAISVPKAVSDKLWKLFTKQAKNKGKKKENRWNFLPNRSKLRGIRKFLIRDFLIRIFTPQQAVGYSTQKF